MCLKDAGKGLSQKEGCCPRLTLTAALTPAVSSWLEDQDLLGQQTCCTWQARNEDDNVGTPTCTGPV